jgi:predicted transcriptional regulator
MDYAKTIDEEIIDYLPHLNDEQKQTVLTVVKNFAEEESDWWDDLSEEQQHAIDQSITEADAGDLIPHEEVMKMVDKWRKK